MHICKKFISSLRVQRGNPVQQASGSGLLRSCWSLAMTTAFFLFFTPLYINPAPANAAEFSGKYLLHVCSSDKSGKEIVKGGHTACQAYIAGLIDYHNMIKSLKTAPGLDFCIPKDTPLAVMQEGIVMYLLRNGQHDDFIASPAVAIALNQMYPCRKRKSKKKK